MSVCPFPQMPPRTYAECRALVLNPQAAAARPGARLLAWSALKSARGQTLSQTSLNRMMSEQQQARAAAAIDTEMKGVRA